MVYVCRLSRRACTWPGCIHAPRRSLRESFGCALASFAGLDPHRLCRFDERIVNFFDKNYLYTRLELVDKDDLLRPADRALLGIKTDHPSFRIGAYTFGGVRDIWTADRISLGVGSDLTFYSTPAIVDRIYGNNPVSWKLFMRIRPGKMDMTMHGTHGTAKSHETN